MIIYQFVKLKQTQICRTRPSLKKKKKIQILGYNTHITIPNRHSADSNVSTVHGKFHDIGLHGEAEVHKPEVTMHSVKSLLE